MRKLLCLYRNRPLRELSRRGRRSGLQSEPRPCPPQTRGQVETWRRTRRQRIGGQTISRFTKSWPASIFSEVLSGQQFGWDKAQLYWGKLKAPDADVDIWLRIASKNLPTAVVRQINERVQYSSHVVNLVLNNFSDPRRVSGDFAFAFVDAAQFFYQHFPDLYDGLSFVMQRDVLSAEYAAFHGMVRNPVDGIGRGTFNSATRYGSGGRLQSYEFYRAGYIVTNSVSTHEAMHQWGDYFDLTELAGVASAGHYPSSHMPLIFPRENYIGAVLSGDRRVQRVGGDIYRIQRTPSPIRQHPLHLYAMGKVPARAVPNIVVFANQGQSGLTIGRRLRGGTRIVTMSDILGRHGPRTGPVQGAGARRVAARDYSDLGGTVGDPAGNELLELLCQADRNECEHDELRWVSFVLSFHRQPDASPDRY